MEGIIIFFFFALGTIFASFMLVIAERMHTGESWHTGRSRCNSCARTLTVRDLVPVLSYMYAHGRCSDCGARVPAAYLVTELILGTLFALAYTVTGFTYALVPLLGALAVLLALVWYDLRHLILPTGLMAPFLFFSFCYAFLANDSPREFGYVLLLAGVTGFFFFLFHLLSWGRAMGLGDAPLALGLALLAGPVAFSGLIYSFWVGGVIGSIMLLRRAYGTKINSEVPFAPFLACGFLIALFTSWDILSILGITIR